MRRTRRRSRFRMVAVVLVLVALLGLAAPVQASAQGDTAIAAQRSSIERLYHAYFLRAPDPEGLKHWVDVATRGVELAVISSYFASSAEFEARYGTVDDTDFVRLVYRNVLTRDPEPGGFAYWTGMLRSGASRGSVMVGFSESSEFKALVKAPQILTSLQIQRHGSTSPAPSTTTVPATAAPAPTSSPGAPAPERSSAGFVHPGVLVGGDQLTYVRNKVAAGAEPWKSALDAMYRSRYASLSYSPKPSSVIQAPSASSQQYIDANPQLGLSAVGDVQHLDDARAAYTHALLYAYTGNRAHAAKAIEIMNAWSSTLGEIKFDNPKRADNGGPVYNNGKLQAGWGGSLFARAAEIIRYSGAGWSSTDVQRFEKLLSDVYLPLVITGWSNGANWLMTLSEATISIGVFTEDRSAFDAGVRMWREKTPTTIYVTADGTRPVPPTPWYDTDDRMRKLWYGPSQYVHGLQAETLRDFGHTTMGLGAMANAAETATLQGVDLYGEQQARVAAGFERTARYLNEYLDEVARLNGSQPSSTWRPSRWVGGSFNLGGSAWKSGWEVAHSHYTQRGVQMPETARLVERLRPSHQAALHMSWETLTHAR